MNAKIQCALLLLFAACASTAHASAARLEVIATDPSESTTLPFGANVNVHVHYVADQPVRVQAKGLLAGEPVPGAMNASPAYDAGEGDALAWISFREHAYVDSVRVTLGDANWKTLAVHDIPIYVDWRADAPPHAEAAWVGPLRDDQQARITEGWRQSASADDGGGGLFLMLLTLSIPGYIALQVIAWARWKGGWRWAALVPLVGMGAVFVYTLFALLAGSNLWPLMLLFLSPLACAWLLVAFLARFVTRRRPA
jgi:hypothetical protein